MKTVLFVYFALVIITLSACQKSGSGEATVSGLNSQCVSNPTACNSGAYQQSQGYSPYNYNNGSNGYNQYSTPFSYNNNTAYLCNCPIGSLPTYNSYAGLGCVRQSASFSGFFYLGWGHKRWNSTPYIRSYSFNNNSNCYSGAVQSCLLSLANSCSPGYICRSNNNASNIGLCVAVVH
jgi:hypothetical protein